MPDFDLKSVLKDCKKSAAVGYKIASRQCKNIKSTLDNAGEKINDTIKDFNSSNYYFSSVTKMLSDQLLDIKQSFNNLSSSFAEELEIRRENLSKFSITLFGRTMTGKSTLMEILTNGDGKSIGEGSQRTTRDIRKYPWNGLEITDVPGIGAFEGEEDEQIAVEAAKTADLILFLITDDGVQTEEAAFLGRVLECGKPVICIMNVKTEVPEDENIEFIIKDIEDAFDMERLNEIKHQFLEYAKTLGQEWGYLPFVYVHLLAAFKAQKHPDKATAKNLHRISRIDFLKNKITEQVKNKGEFFRIKNFADAVSEEMLNSMECLLEQSIKNSKQGRVILSKKRQLADWKEGFERDGKSRIDTFVKNIESRLNREIADFAEEHFEDKDADKAWNQKIKNKRIPSKCKALLKDLEEQCNNKIQEFTREIGKELNFTASFTGNGSLKTHKLIDGKRMWNWSAAILGGGLAIAEIVTAGLGLAAAGPLGWLVAAVSIIGFAGSFLFKSREQKEYEARKKLEKSLKKNVSEICKSLRAQMEKNFELIFVRIESLMKEMDRINAVLFRLADTQKELAWELDEHYLELSRQIVTQAIKLIGAEGLESSIRAVGRIPASAAMFVLDSGVEFPAQRKNQLQRLMAERIFFTHYDDRNNIFISKIIGKTAEGEWVKVNVEEKIGVAHVSLANLTPDVENRVRIAMQLSKLAITD